MAISGDGTAGGTLYLKFSTRAFATGVPTTLAGSPVVSIYKDNSTTESVAGVTLIVDFDGRTGLNHVTINTAADAAFYTNGSHFELVITTGTVGGTNVVGEVVGSFNLAVASLTAAAVWDEINTGATHNLTNSTGRQLRSISSTAGGVIYTGTCPSQVGMTSTQIKLDAAASAVSNIYRYNVISIITGTGAGDSAVILSYDGTTKIATVDEPWAVQPDATSVFEITPGAKALVIDKTGFSLSATGLDLIPSGALNGKGDWLTSLGSTAPAGWIDASSIAAGALNGKGDWSTLSASDVWLAGSRTLTSGAGIVLAKGIGVTGFNDLDAVGIRAALGMNIANLDAQLATLPTAAQAADKLLGRNIAGGSDGGRTVAEAFAFMRNKWEISGGTLIVYAANDTTTLWTASVTTTAGNPVTAIDPA